MSRKLVSQPPKLPCKKIEPKKRKSFRSLIFIFLSDQNTFSVNACSGLGLVLVGGTVETVRSENPCFKNLALVASDWVPKVMGWIQTDLGLEPSTAFFKLILGKLLFHCDGMKVSNINRLNSTTFPC